MKTACVYTCLFGGYEELGEQPAAAQSRLPFVCFTDDPGLESSTWDVRVVEPVLRGDAARSSRHPKILAHRHLDDFDTSLYIDNSVHLLRAPDALLADVLPPDGPPIAVNAHSFHFTLEQEARAIADHGFEDPARLDETLAMLSTPDVAMLDAAPFWGGMIARRHHDTRVADAMETWWLHVLRYSRRDQLTLPLALRIHDLVPGDIGLDNHRSDDHEWPVDRRRRRARDDARAGAPETGRGGRRIGALVRRRSR